MLAQIWRENVHEAFEGIPNDVPQRPLDITHSFRNMTDLGGKYLSCVNLNRNSVNF